MRLVVKDHLCLSRGERVIHTNTTYVEGEAVLHLMKQDGKTVEVTEKSGVIRPINRGSVIHHVVQDFKVIATIAHADYENPILYHVFDRAWKEEGYTTPHAESFRKAVNMAVNLYGHPDLPFEVKTREPGEPLSYSSVISEEMVSNLITNWVESGQGRAWCDLFELVSIHDCVTSAKKDGGPWYSEADLYREDFRIRLVEATDDPEAEEWFLTRSMLQRGLDVLSERYPKRIREIVEENDDAETADVFVQCCVFGEILYG